MSHYTKADFLQRAGDKTPVFVRFSTVAGGAGSGDLARDVRGFATKFYTRKGNFDLVGNNIPVFFIQDAMKFPDLGNVFSIAAVWCQARFSLMCSLPKNNAVSQGSRFSP